ncbi:MAG TPA: hypothetical protein VFI70_04950 [Nitrososphaeraceae archaeon]|nr:hypothetical protein [Nitrososphaeraceae archaeon]
MLEKNISSKVIERTIGTITTRDKEKIEPDLPTSIRYVSRRYRDCENKK